MSNKDRNTTQERVKSCLQHTNLVSDHIRVQSEYLKRQHEILADYNAIQRKVSSGAIQYCHYSRENKSNWVSKVSDVIRVRLLQKQIFILVG